MGLIQPYFPQVFAMKKRRENWMKTGEIEPIGSMYVIFTYIYHDLSIYIHDLVFREFFWWKKLGVAFDHPRFCSEKNTCRHHIFPGGDMTGQEVIFTMLLRMIIPGPSSTHNPINPLFFKGWKISNQLFASSQSGTQNFRHGPNSWEKTRKWTWFPKRDPKLVLKDKLFGWKWWAQKFHRLSGEIS